MGFCSTLLRTGHESLVLEVVPGQPDHPFWRWVTRPWRQTGVGGGADDEAMQRLRSRFAARRKGAAAELCGPWPFADPVDLAVYTTKAVMTGGAAIVQVSHEAGDGSWRFLPAGDADLEDAAVVALAEALWWEPAVAGLADLPLGWRARRPHRGAAWTRTRS